MKYIRIESPRLLAGCRPFCQSLLAAAALVVGGTFSLPGQTVALDFGDAPKPYPTIMNEGGAFHAQLKGFNLGRLVDTEADGQPSSLANGDDASPAGVPSDEDGIVFNTNPLLPGQLANITVTLSAGNGRLDAWIDFNRNGSWDDAGEQVLTSSSIGAGSTGLRFVVPENAVPGTTFARFRLSREGGLKPTGFAQDGEVEDYAIAIQGEQISRDFGDAPAPYPTTLKDNGARHRVLKGFNLGELIDVEVDGQPNDDAVGDDKNPATAGSDEDGVILQTDPLLIGRQALVEFLLTGQQGRLDGWVDFNGDGDWLDEGEQIFRSEGLTSGVNPKTFIVPANAVAGLSYARFRLSQQGGLTPVGEAFDGEVEDYIVRIDKPQELFDFGDAPAPYPTLLAENGARHTLLQGFFLGRVIDLEVNGNRNADATGDDITGSANIGDDEDGVRFLSTVLTGGTTAQVEVTLSSGRGVLDAWIDFNRDGDWADPGDQIAQSFVLNAGVNTLSFSVPATTVAGNSFSRFRLTQQGGVSFTGAAPVGEVEDHMVQLEKIVETFDFGDAPAPYPTLLAANGARHSTSRGFSLGPLVDMEQNGQPNADATGDDIAGTATAGDDEDGVRFLSTVLRGGTTAQVEVTLNGTGGMLDAWIDFNRDGDWADAGEQIATSRSLVTGANTISFTVPQSTVGGLSFARFRLSGQGGLTPVGAASLGEVEDHQVTLEKALDTFDFGDAPAPYPTLLADNGARHPFKEGFFLGPSFDQETNGQPNANATGDDAVVAGTPVRDDEDGVKFLSSVLTGGTAAQVEVVLTGTRGMLDAWIDFNRDGDWADSGEQIATAHLLSTGLNTLTFTPPVTATAGGISFARFRVSSQGGLAPTGLAADGEVEDYQVTLEKFVPSFDFGDAPQTYPTLLASNGARHVFREGFLLGRLIDLERDGQPNAGATGDDANNPGTASSDEDGVKFLAAPLVPTQTAKVEVSLLSGQGRLDAWIDFNRDGDWADAGEQIFTSQALVAGVNTLDIKIPDNAVAGESYARFRLSLQGGLTFAGQASEGEVEDYLVRIGTKPEATVDLLITKVDSPDPVLQGETLTYTIAVSNNGSTPATGVVVTDQVHSSATVIDVISSNGSCNVSATGLVTCNLGTLAVRQTSTITIRVSPNVAGTLTNTATVTSTEPDRNTANNSSTTTTTVVRRNQVPCDERTNRGTNFWLTFPGNYAPDPDNPIRLSIAIIGQRLTTGTVAIPGLGFSTNFTIPGSMEIVIPLPSAADLGSAIDVVENKGINVRASAEVAVFGLNRVLYTTDGYLGLPTDVVGQAYLVQAYKNVHTGVPELNGTQFAIVGTEDNTRVGIRPTAQAGVRNAGVPYTIVLNRGQTYQLRSTNDAPADLSGTIIIADKPVSVFSGHHCANVASQDMWFCDHLVEQLVSIERAGTRFLSMPLATRTGGDTFRFAALQNDTTVSVNGSIIATLNAGQITERIINGPSQILSDKPILVTQFSNSSDYDGRTNADPFMIVLPHQGQFLNRVPVWTPNAGFGSHYINVVAPTAAIGTVTLDGVAIPAASFSGIPGSGYSGAQLLVTPGAHLVTADVPVGVICYGWAEFDSYGFPGGMFFGDTQPPELICPESPIIVKLGQSSTSPCTTTIPDLRQMVQVTDNCSLPERITINQEPKPGTIVGPGDYQIVLSTSDAKGNIGFCVVDFRVIDESPVTLICPQNMFVNCQTEEGAKVDFRVVARGRCDNDTNVTSEPPSGSFFPIGTTTVTSTYVGADGKTQTCTFTVTVQCNPTLVITRAPDNKVQLSWGGNQMLQTALDITGPWTTVSNANPPFTVTAQGTRGYFRIVPKPQ